MNDSVLFTVEVILNHMLYEEYFLLLINATHFCLLHKKIEVSERSSVPSFVDTWTSTFLVERKSLLVFEDNFHLSPLAMTPQGSHTFFHQSLLSPVPSDYFLFQLSSFSYFFNLSSGYSFSIQYIRDSKLFGTKTKPPSMTH